LKALSKCRLSRLLEIVSFMSSVPSRVGALSRCTD
jgi:hypothetical protein